MMEIMFDLASCEPHRRNPNPHRGLWSSKEQLALAAPPGGRDLGWALLGFPAVERPLGNNPGTAVTEQSPRSQSLRFWLEGGLGGHDCQV